MSGMGQSIRLNFIELLISCMSDQRTQTLAESWHGFETLHRFNLSNTAKIALPTINSKDKFHNTDTDIRKANTGIRHSFFTVNDPVFVVEA